MEATPLKISRTDFESAVPAAKMKNDSVFLMLLSKFETAYVDLVQEMLGSVGEDAALGSENTMLLLLAKTMVCQRTFIDNFRSLDVVLTATGFGVVSTPYFYFQLKRHIFAASLPEFGATTFCIR